MEKILFYQLKLFIKDYISKLFHTVRQKIKNMITLFKKYKNIKKLA